ncbi:MAG: endonuclease/exonuclease/phosphatase family protein [Planctomycetota bacterium]
MALVIAVTGSRNAPIAMASSAELASFHPAGSTASAGSFSTPLSDEQKNQSLHEDEQGSDVLRVMSFNIRYGTARDGDNAWPHRRDLVTNLICENGGDIIGLQEALAFQIAEILQACPKYTRIGVGRDDGRDRGEFTAILFDRSKWLPVEFDTFWLSDTPDVVASTSWGNSIPRICTWALLEEVRENIDTRKSGRNDSLSDETDTTATVTATAIANSSPDHGNEESRPPRRVLVYNTHFDHRSENARRESAKAIVARAAADRQRLARPGEILPVIITGDFNAGETSEPIRIMKSGNVDAERRAKNETSDRDVNTSATDPVAPIRFFDTFRVLFPDAPEVGTFTGFDPERTTGAKIDYVFATPDLKVVGAGIDRTTSPDGKRTPSDHLPVWAEFAWPNVRSTGH